MWTEESLAELNQIVEAKRLLLDEEDRPRDGENIFVRYKFDLYALDMRLRVEARVAHHRPHGRKYPNTAASALFEGVTGPVQAVLTKCPRSIGVEFEDPRLITVVSEYAYMCHPAIFTEVASEDVLGEFAELMGFKIFRV